MKESLDAIRTLFHVLLGTSAAVLAFALSTPTISHRDVDQAIATLRMLPTIPKPYDDYAAFAGEISRVDATADLGRTAIKRTSPKIEFDAGFYIQSWISLDRRVESLQVVSDWERLLRNEQACLARIVDVEQRIEVPSAITSVEFPEHWEPNQSNNKATVQLVHSKGRVSVSVKYDFLCRTEFGPRAWLLARPHEGNRAKWIVSEQGRRELLNQLHDTPDLLRSLRVFLADISSKTPTESIAALNDQAGKLRRQLNLFGIPVEQDAVALFGPTAILLLTLALRLHLKQAARMTDLTLEERRVLETFPWMGTFVSQVAPALAAIAMTALPVLASALLIWRVRADVSSAVLVIAVLSLLLTALLSRGLVGAMYALRAVRMG